MSTSMLGKPTDIIDTRDDLTEAEDLSDYVKRILKVKRLSLRDVQRRSSGRITQGYVGAIVQRANTNLSIEKLKALASGLGVDEDEVFRVARGLSKPVDARERADDQLNMLRVLELMRNIVSDPDMYELVEQLLQMPPDARRVIARAIRMLSKAENTSRRDKKLG